MKGTISLSHRRSRLVARSSPGTAQRTRHFRSLAVSLCFARTNPPLCQWWHLCRLSCTFLCIACEQAHLFGWGAATESWREEWGEEKSLFLALHALFLASPVLGTQTSEPARRLTYALLEVDLHGTTLSLSTSLRQAYDMNCFCKSNLQLAYDICFRGANEENENFSVKCFLPAFYFVELTTDSNYLQVERILLLITRSCIIFILVRFFLGDAVAWLRENYRFLYRHLCFFYQFDWA